MQEDDALSSDPSKRIVEPPTPDASVFPTPAAREYILRTVASRPAPYSKQFPQRMYCTLVDGAEYRLAGAFTSDTTFQ